MNTIDSVEFRRLILQIEQDLLAQARLRLLLTTASITTTDHQEELAVVKARMKTPAPASHSSRRTMS